MGVTNAKKICEKLLSKSNIFEICRGNIGKHKSSTHNTIPLMEITSNEKFKAKFNKVNVYVDGPLWVFSSIPQNETDTIKIVNFMKKKLENRLIKLLLYYVNEILSVTIHFDGRAPPMKLSTQSRRKIYQPQSYNISQIFKQFKELLKKKGTVEISMKNGKFITPIKVAEHVLGESEHFIYSERDIAHPSILFTKDTDIFMIAYNHAKKGEHDDVCLMLDNTFYDLSEFKCPLNSGPFRVLLILCGTDFNRNIFTQTMSINVLETICQNDSVVIKELVDKINNCSEFVNVVGYFLEILLANQLANVTFPPNRKLRTIDSETNTQYSYSDNVAKLQWIWQYFTDGVHHEDYQNKTLVDIQINKNLLLKDILIQHLKLDAEQYKNNSFKEILLSLKNA